MNRPASPFELPKERLASTDETGARVYIHPADVKGPLRRARNVIYTLLAGLFLAGPWIKIFGHPLFLFNLPQRRFSVFGFMFWADDAPILVLVLLSFMFFIAGSTALFGRVWCGWACPQTVFVDGIFRKIERWIEGDAFSRRKLDTAPIGLHKILKKIFKWSIFALISLVITHNFLAYFVGPEALRSLVTHSPLQHPVAALFIAFSTAIILFDFGWFREQFCIIACPYGRLQSVLVDPETLVVAYDTKRGPTDCINCYRCVQVCPTGIDIRRGLQLECVMCTSCIDACNVVMDKIQKPKGLIRYTSEAIINGASKRFLRTRTIIYLALFSIVFSTLFVVAAHRSPVRIGFKKAAVPYELVGENIINQVQVKLYNRDFTDLALTFKLAQHDQEKGVTLVVPGTPFPVKAGENGLTSAFFTIPKASMLDDELPVQLTITAKDAAGNIVWEHQEKVELVGPDNEDD